MLVRSRRTVVPEDIAERLQAGFGWRVEDQVDRPGVWVKQDQSAEKREVTVLRVAPTGDSSKSSSPNN